MNNFDFREQAPAPSIATSLPTRNGYLVTSVPRRWSYAAGGSAGAGFESRHKSLSVWNPTSSFVTGVVGEDWEGVFLFVTGWMKATSSNTSNTETCYFWRKIKIRLFH
jgi:hypothetical protein